MENEVHLCANRGICTENCPYRSTCKMERFKFLICGVVIDGRNQRVYGEEYLNEVMLKKVEFVEDFHAAHPEHKRSLVFPTMAV